jgi:hypothetical protein
MPPSDGPFFIICISTVSCQHGMASLEALHGFMKNSWDVALVPWRKQNEQWSMVSLSTMRCFLAMESGPMFEFYYNGLLLPYEVSAVYHPLFPFWGDITTVHILPVKKNMSNFSSHSSWGLRTCTSIFVLDKKLQILVSRGLSWIANLRVLNFLG